MRRQMMVWRNPGCGTQGVDTSQSSLSLKIEEEENKEEDVQGSG